MTREDSPSVPDKELGSRYREIVGSLQWLATCTRPDLAHAAQALATFSSNPGPEHMKEAKRTLRYLNGTIDLGITYTRNSTSLANTMFGFCDSDWAACLDTRRSIGAYVLLLNGGAIAWRSKKQPSVALSTAEAEFMAASSTANTTLWLRRILKDLGAPQPGPSPLYEDNQACILLSTNSSHQGRTRHIDMHVHALKDHVANGIVRLVSCPTVHMTADLCTKALPGPAFLRHRAVIMGQALPTAPPLAAPALVFTARVHRLAARRQLSTLVHL